MAKFDDYTQKNTPEDNDITLILDKTANVNKKTPFSGIWNWIVNKMTNAVIQNLQTTNKTVIGSINELNSNALHFTYGSTERSDTINFEIESSRATAVLIGNNDAGESYFGMISLNGSSVSITKIAGSAGTDLVISKDENTVSISGVRKWFLYAIMSTAKITIL